MSRLRTAAVFVFMGLAFGTAFPAIKAGLADAEPLLFAAARFYLSAVLLGGLLLVSGREWRPRTRADWLVVAVGGVFNIGGAGFLYLGQQFTTAGVSAIIFSLGPVLTVLLALVLLPGERASARTVAGVLIGLVGVGLVVRPSPAALVAPDLLGKLLVVIAIASLTLGSVLIRRVDAPISPTAMTAWTLALGAGLLHGASVALGEPQALPTTPSFLAILAYLAVVPSGIAFALYFTLLRRAGPLQANLVVYVVPVVAVVVGWVWLGETLSPLSIVGFLVVFAGFVLIELDEVVDLVGEGRRRLSARVPSRR
jgi:drug/metabolite transporter (DMT)-like permease